MTVPFTSISCRGERCTICGNPAAAKIGEEIMHDDPNRNRHNYTAYVCAEHFAMIFRIGGRIFTDDSCDD